MERKQHPTYTDSITFSKKQQNKLKAIESISNKTVEHLTLK